MRISDWSSDVCSSDLERALLDRLVAAYETEWSLAGLPASYIEGMVRGIVTFEIPIARIEGKCKLSQNRASMDRRRVAERLAAARTSVVSGKSVPVRVALGGRRIIKKNNQHHYH